MIPSVETIVLLIIAVTNLGTALLAWKANVAIKKTSADILKIEVATNSMKDALVRASHAEGVVLGVKQEQERSNVEK